MSAPENPSAFPSVCLNDPGHPESVPGMSLRDWFAGQALVAFGKPYGGRDDDTHARRDYLFREHAKAVYALADAMLAERKAGGEA